MARAVGYSSDLTLTIKSNLYSSSKGIAAQLKKITGGPSEISKFFGASVRDAAKSYIADRSALQPGAVAAINFALGELVAEMMRFQMPVWSGSLQRAVIFDLSSSNNVSMPDGSIITGKNKPRKFSVTVKIGLDTRSIRYERSTQFAELKRLGVAVSMERISDYKLVQDGLVFTKARQEVIGNLGAIFRSAIGGNAKAFFNTRGSMEALQAIIWRLNNMRADYEQRNNTEIESMASKRISFRNRQLADRKRNKVKKGSKNI